MQTPSYNRLSPLERSTLRALETLYQRRLITLMQYGRQPSRLPEPVPRWLQNNPVAHGLACAIMKSTLTPDDVRIVATDHSHPDMTYDFETGESLNPFERRRYK